jgi:hypothetical protein
MRRIVLLLLALCFAGASGTAASAKVARARVQSSRMYVQGTMVGIGGRRAGINRPFTLIVNNYSAADDVQRLNEALRSGGRS